VATPKRSARAPANEPATFAADGRVRRSQRSRAAMVEALYALVGEGVLQPTAQQVAARAKVGMRTVFRHFSDMESLLAEIDARVREHALPVLLAAAPEGPLDARARALVARRAQFFEQIGPWKRAGTLQRWRSAFVAGQHAALVRILRAELLRWLPELEGKSDELVAALDAALSFEIWERLRHDQHLGRARAQAAVERTVLALLHAPER